MSQPSITVLIRRSVTPLLLALAVTACGKSGEGTGNTVTMKDMEVVDGTTTDAMTDLDGVRAEGTAMAPMSGNASAAKATLAKKAEDTSAPAEGDAEVVSDQ